ncbi:MAG: glycosyltransferase [Pseudomonadota bacterium]
MERALKRKIDDLSLMILVTWKEEGEWDLNKALKERIRRLEVLQPFILRWPRGKFWKKVTTKLCNFYIPIIALFKRRDFDAVFSWSMRMGICYGLVNRYFHHPSSPKHVFRDFHIDLTRKDRMYRLKTLILRLALPGIDYVLCTSREEEKKYSQMFHIPPEKIQFYPDSPSRHLLESYPFSRKDYIFSYGNSDRDFDTLVEASRNFKKRVIILSQRYTPERSLPDTVQLITDTISEGGLIEFITSSRLVVLPLVDYAVSAGQNTMVEAMALGRPLVVTANMATIEYATHGETALFTKAKDPKELERRIRFLWDHPEEAERMGQRAKELAFRHAERGVSLFFQILEDLFCSPFNEASTHSPSFLSHRDGSLR